MPTLSLKSWIIVFFVLLLFLVQVAGFLLIDRANSHNVQSKIEQELQAGEQAFVSLLDEHRVRLKRAGTVLAGDFGFRQALATNERATILSALRNHASRVGANAAMAISLDDCDGPIAALTCGMTLSAISSIERLASAGSTQSMPA